jgi:hypothetical protein
MAFGDGLEIGQDSNLRSVFGSAAGVGVIGPQTPALADKGPSMQVAQADGPSTPIRLDTDRGRFFPVDPDTGRMIIHAGPDKQGFKTTPFGPGKGFGG